MRSVFSILFLTLALLGFSLEAIANPNPPSIYSLLEDQYGGRESTGPTSRFCLWDTKDGLGIGWLFGMSAREMPIEVCMTGIRLIIVQMAHEFPSIYAEGKFHYYESKTPTWSTNREEDNNLLQVCKTRPLKQPYDKLTPELRNKFIQIFQTQGFDAGLNELNKFLDQNIAYSCSLHGA